MLILSRGIGEGIVIGDDIRVTVVAVRGHRVRLDITTPTRVSVERSELSAFQSKEAGSDQATKLEYTLRTQNSVRPRER